MIKLVNTALSAITVLSFIGGPGGIVFASGIVFLQGLMPAGEGQAKAIEALANVFKEDKYTTVIQKQSAKLKSLSNWIHLREEVWKQADPDLASFKNEDVKRLETELSGETNSLATEVTYLEDSIMSWDRPETRIVVLLSYTLLFVCYSIICRLHAESAEIERKKTTKKDEVLMKSETASFRAWLKIFRNDLKAKADSYNNKLTSIIDTRRKQIQWKGSDSASFGAGEFNPPATSYWWEWKDEFTGKSHSTDYQRGLFSDGNKDEKEKEARDNMATYVKGFEDHVTRARKNDDAIVNSWYGLVEQCEGLLKPPTPLIPPAVSVSPKTLLFFSSLILTISFCKATPTKVNNPHPALKENAVKYVSYAYRLDTTDDGFSGLSPWADWIPLPREGDSVRLPAITLKNGGYLIETKRKVYRDMLKEDKKEGSRKPGSDEDVERLLVDEIEKSLGPKNWIDTEPDVHGGRPSA
jgi:hypothetical protein